jgi:signal transduction histidine kinase/ActR/RegA family two-component response regulator
VAEARREALAICGLFVAAGTVWLLLPSALLGRDEGGPGSRLHLVGDVAFLGVSAVLLYVLFRRALAPQASARPGPGGAPAASAAAPDRTAALVHDLGNVLTAISGHAELALERVPPGHAAFADLTALRAAVQRGQRLARATADAPPPAEPADLSALVVEIGRILPRLAGAAIRVETRLDLAPAPVLVDPARLEQVLLNLALNAREAMPAGGRLQVRVSPWRPAGAGPAHVELAVSDTGHGFDALARERLFEPWFSTRGRGSGLGLATVAEVVREAGGHVDVESQPGHGATFRVRLPLAAVPAVTAPDAVEALPPAAAQPASRAAGATPADATGTLPAVLVVDDDPDVCDVLGSVLRDAGWTTLRAADGREALELVQRHPVAVVLLDMLMPGKEGLETVTELRMRHPQLPVVAMSGASRASNYLTLATKLGAVAALEKPFGPDELLRTIAAVMRPPSASATPETQAV